jgi:hypothetical protein
LLLMDAQMKATNALQAWYFHSATTELRICPAEDGWFHFCTVLQSDWLRYVCLPYHIGSVLWITFDWSIFWMIWWLMHYIGITVWRLVYNFLLWG